MKDDSVKTIVSLLGIAGFILYGYLLFMSDISAEYQKYTVIVASLGLLFPMVSLSSIELMPGKKYKAYGIGFVGACVILSAGYFSKVDTEDGLIWDFLTAISTEGYRYFYFIILLLANICPLISKRYSFWLSAFTIGVMLPVLITSLLVLAIIIGGLSALGASGKSNSSSNSWSSIFSNSSGTNDHKNGGDNPSSLHKDDYSYTPRVYYKVEWKHNRQPLTSTAHLELPFDATVNDFKNRLQKMYGGEITIVSYRRGSAPTVYLE